MIVPARSPVLLIQLLLLPALKGTLAQLGTSTVVPPADATSWAPTPVTKAIEPRWTCAPGNPCPADAVCWTQRGYGGSCASVAQYPACGYVTALTTQLSCPLGFTCIQNPHSTSMCVRPSVCMGTTASEPWGTGASPTGCPYPQRCEGAIPGWGCDPAQASGCCPGFCI
jgi:hypothetical protein